MHMPAKIRNVSLGVLFIATVGAYSCFANKLPLTSVSTGSQKSMVLCSEQPQQSSLDAATAKELFDTYAKKNFLSFIGAVADSSAYGEKYSKSLKSFGYFRFLEFICSEFSKCVQAKPSLKKEAYRLLLDGYKTVQDKDRSLSEQMITAAKEYRTPISVEISAKLNKFVSFGLGKLDEVNDVGGDGYSYVGEDGQLSDKGRWFKVRAGKLNDRVEITRENGKKEMYQKKGAKMLVSFLEVDTDHELNKQTGDTCVILHENAWVTPVPWIGEFGLELDATKGAGLELQIWKKGDNYVIYLGKEGDQRKVAEGKDVEAPLLEKYSIYPSDESYSSIKKLYSNSVMKASKPVKESWHEGDKEDELPH